MGNNTHKNINTTTTKPAKPDFIQRSHSLPSTHHSHTNNNMQHTIPLHSESTIYDKAVNSTSNKRHKSNNKCAEIVDLISPPDSPSSHSVSITSTNDHILAINDDSSNYTALAPSARRSKRVVYDSDEDTISTHNHTANSMHRRVSDGFLASHTNTTQPSTLTTNNASIDMTSTSSMVHATLQTMSKRDGTFSSMHSVGKLLRATLGKSTAILSNNLTQRWNNNYFFLL